MGAQLLDGVRFPGQRVSVDRQTDLERNRRVVVVAFPSQTCPTADPTRVLQHDATALGLATEHGSTPCHHPSRDQHTRQAGREDAANPTILRDQRVGLGVCGSDERGRWRRRWTWGCGCGWGECGERPSDLHPPCDPPEARPLAGRRHQRPPRTGPPEQHPSPPQPAAADKDPAFCPRRTGREEGCLPRRRHHRGGRVRRCP